MRKGFTVIETVIVLIIIGILIGIVIRGATSTFSAKVNATIECFRINLASTEAYLQNFRQLPGDINRDGQIESDSALIILQNAGFDVKFKNPFGGDFKLLYQSRPGLEPGNYIYTNAIPANADSLIDARIDDGNLSTGKYRRVNNISFLKL